MKDLPVRKHPRLKGYDYSNSGAYFLTFCVKDRREILGTVGRGIPDAPCVGRGILDAPCVHLSEYGRVITESIEFLNNMNDAIAVDKYAVMPNHVHLIVIVDNPKNGASGKPRPTNAVIPKLISSIKRYASKRAGFDMWQTSYHDHIIRNEAEYQKIWQYIDENPAKWQEDQYCGK